MEIELEKLNKYELTSFIKGLDNLFRPEQRELQTKAIKLLHSKYKTL